jgi:hypothetical protein
MRSAYSINREEEETILVALFDGSLQNATTR